MVCDGTWQTASTSRAPSVVRVVLVCLPSLADAPARGAPDTRLPSSDVPEALTFHQLSLLLALDVLLPSPTCPVAAAGDSSGGSLPRCFVRAVSDNGGHVPAPKLQVLLSLRAERRPRFAGEWAQVTPHWVSALERPSRLFSRRFAYDPVQCSYPMWLTTTAVDACRVGVVLNARPVLICWTLAMRLAVSIGRAQRAFCIETGYGQRLTMDGFSTRFVLVRLR